MGPHVLPYFQQYVKDEDAPLRQAAAYGIGQLAEHAIQFECVRAATPELVATLHHIIVHAESRSQDNVYATDNCISALGKFVEFGSAIIDAKQYLQAWLGYLPVTGDLEEGKEIYNRLCDFLEKASAEVLGDNNVNLGQVMKVFATALETKAVDDALTLRIKKIAEALNAQMPAVLQAACNGLDQEQMEKLQRLATN